MNRKIKREDMGDLLPRKENLRGRSVLLDCFIDAKGRPSTC